MDSIGHATRGLHVQLPCRVDYATVSGEVDIRGGVMEGNRKMDLRVQKTREAIQQAFRDMVMEGDASQINVTELSRRARIHRKTFYLHYTCIEALYEDMIRIASEGYYAAIDRIDPKMPMAEVNRVFFEYLAAADPFVERLICEPSYRPFCNAMFAAALRHNRERHNPYAALSEPEQSIVNNFLAGSSLDMYRQWVADGKKVPLDDLIALSTKLLCTGVESLDLV
ncbi:TetR/AcrR family transcriptional regulator [Actinomyces sp. MRS3W]|uniref:TetR/AcrR family transcriptional regulator n=1 Tax=Actinomyces sp. MRS3W TaxID=2800796 RepID=UPI0028FD65AB|nr:TetR/AcrR family transcriptional regulator [Actinomyces sp. MRS3W]MDU0347410.1 TetR/AcrR family transcriptional regulator [Actinomyces sp. MRS3W]